jgi:hypothetical protein
MQKNNNLSITLYNKKVNQDREKCLIKFEDDWFYLIVTFMILSKCLGSSI